MEAAITTRTMVGEVLVHTMAHHSGVIGAITGAGTITMEHILSVFIPFPPSYRQFGNNTNLQFQAPSRHGYSSTHPSIGTRIARFFSPRPRHHYY